MGFYNNNTKNSKTINDNIPEDIIYEIMKKFLIGNNHDIGIEIYDIIPEKMNLDDFIKNIPDIFVKKILIQ